MEGKHALAKCRLRRRVSAHPLPQLFSSELRYVEFNRRAQDPEFYARMLSHFQSCRDPLDVVAAFSMANHTFLGKTLERYGQLSQKN
eukprot:13540261-Alexandrium_andersonii.AAC.1